MPRIGSRSLPPSASGGEGGGLHSLSLPARRSKCKTADTSQCKHDLPAMPLSRAELVDRSACRALARSGGAGSIVYQLPRRHSWLQYERDFPECFTGKQDSLTKQMPSPEFFGQCICNRIGASKATRLLKRRFLNANLRRGRHPLRSAKLSALRD